MKIFAIGDIHGEFDKLRGLIKKLPLDKNSLLVFLGDYTDRGEHSFEVIGYLIKLNTQYKCIFLKGNHEDMFMDFMSGINEGFFVHNGGYNTIQSYENNGYNIHQNVYYKERCIPEKHVRFYQNLKIYYQTNNYIFVHAGLDENISLDQQPIDTLLWERYDFINSNFDWGKKVIFGHTPNKKVLNMHNKICIDTGAYFEMGKLTCVVLPDEYFVQQGVY